MTLVLEQRYPNWRELTIHESSPVNRGLSRRLGSKGRYYIPTHFYSDRALGTQVDGTRCENLEALTFEDESIDVHITQDVLEHVLRPERAFAEIARTLKPGGAHIFTTPLVNKAEPSRRRIEIGPGATVSHLLPPVFHGNPIDPEGSLVTMDWGFDIVEHIALASGLNTEIIHIDDLSRGIRAEYIEVLVTAKPVHPA